MGDDLSDKIFCDMFAGTGIVERTFKVEVNKVIANDLKDYSFVLNKNYIGNHKNIKNKVANTAYVYGAFLKHIKNSASKELILEPTYFIIEIQGDILYLDPSYNQRQYSFQELIEKTKFEYIFLSYNNEELMSADEEREIMEEYGEYTLVQKEYQRFKATKTYEYLHILEKYLQ